MQASNAFSRTLILIIVLASVGQMTNTIYAPAMGLMADYFHEVPARIQSVMGLYLLPYGLSQFIYGPLSDRFGRRPIILLGLLIFVVGSALTIMTVHLDDLLLGSFFQGLGIGVGGVMVRTVPRDLYSGQALHRANSYTSGALIIAPLIAPVLGGVLANWFGWRSNFIFLGAFGLAMLIVQYRYFKETNQFLGHADTKLSRVFSSYVKVLGHKTFVGYMTCLLVSFAGVAVFEASAGILFTDILGYTPAAASLLYILPLPAYLLGAFISGRLGKFFTLPKIIFIGIVMLAVGAILMLLGGLFLMVSASTILLPICFTFTGVGILFPAGTSGALDPFPSLAGTAGSILGGMQNIGASVAIMISAAFHQTDQLPLAFILCGLTALVAVIYYYFLREDEIKRYQ